jgi:ABC-type nitrate/sulfonate/bicarbonate transport system substrate-binding protein
VPIQAPKNYTADITLRKGNAADSSLPVLVRRTDLEKDYPLLTKELAAKIEKSQNWTARASSLLGLKGDPKYHQAVRASSTSLVHRYSAAAVQILKEKLQAEPDFDPYHPG